MFLDKFFSTRFEEFYEAHYISIVNSPLLLLTDYFKELQSQLPAEYSYEQSSLTGVDLEDEDLIMYHDKKSYFFEQLGKCDLILLVAGLYDLKSNDYYIDFLMENDSRVKYYDEYGTFDNLCLAGGIFANVKINCKFESRISKSTLAKSNSRMNFS